MQDLEGVTKSKDRILSTLRLKGPCLPVQIAKSIEFSPLFASAFLSELKSEGRVKISNMRVGSSPLYYLDGQEEMLEKFSGYLNQREKEAFFLLKDKKVLVDDEQTPVMRVALRAIKDFAYSIKIRMNGEMKLFWKYFSVDDGEIAKVIKGGPVLKKEVVEKPEPKKVEEVVEERVENKEDVKEEPKKEFSPRIEVQKALEGEKRPLAEKKKQKVVDNEFVINVKDYLRAKEMEILEVYAERKREFEARVRIDTMLGKQEFYLVAKDKKSVGENDFAMAWQKGQEKKVLGMVMCTGVLNKKGKEHYEQWNNLVKWERLRF
jgi:hypothetical protein